MIQHYSLNPAPQQKSSGSRHQSQPFFGERARDLAALGRVRVDFCRLAFHFKLRSSSFQAPQHLASLPCCSIFAVKVSGMMLSIVDLDVFRQSEDSRAVQAEADKVSTNVKSDVDP